MRRTFLVMLAVLVAALGCSPGDGGAPVEPPTAGAPSSTPPGIAAAERFMSTWNTRDPATWASSLVFPHARPSVGSVPIWQTREEYEAGAAEGYERVLATGWDHTEFEDLRLIHAGDKKAHVAGRWGRVDAEGNKIRRNLVTYVAAEVDGQWGIQARFGAGAPVPEEEAQPIAEQALAVVEEYMNAFNARDPERWGATLHYPHLRIAGGELRVTESQEELVAGMDFAAFAERYGWDHSGWDEVEAIQVAENGVNVALTASRYDASGAVISTFDTLYLVTKEEGRWGIRARSSFAP